MDPISQGALGAVAALCLSNRASVRMAALAGGVGGALADADVLIRSAQDPLLAIEYHRHFTHALAFIPIGGLIAAAFLYPFFRRSYRFASIYLYAAAGYATAGLLDACTSYGTQLLWPFSDARISWSIISIVDPLFTLPLLGLLAWCLIKRLPNASRVAALYACAYLALGMTQRIRAESAQADLLAERGHATASARAVKPSLANLVLWRSVYLYQGKYYVDAVRVGFATSNRSYPGTSIPMLELETALGEAGDDPVRRDDLRRFFHFSDGYVAALPDEPTFLTDLRYSAVPNAIAPLWGLDLSETTTSGHAQFTARRELSDDERARFLRMLRGE